MSGMVEAAALWKPNEKQSFKSNLPWQPVTLFYQEHQDDTVKYFCKYFTRQINPTFNIFNGMYKSSDGRLCDIIIQYSRNNGSRASSLVRIIVIKYINLPAYVSVEHMSEVYTTALISKRLAGSSEGARGQQAVVRRALELYRHADHDGRRC